ncbi:MAG: hypothetical protein L0Z55_12230 [Planctomycetes bacterium]|nr:hypothetical protein [Planctomycetota bacterium]
MVGVPGLPAEFIVEIRNSILWDNDGPLFDLPDGELTVEYSDVEGSYAGTGNIDLDPLFVDLEQGDLHLTAESPCIDAGDPEDPPDLDGTVADMGAYFYMQFGFLRGEVDGNGTVNALLDAIALLAWQFGGGEAPSCMDAADADDNGVVNALLDALYLLHWNFLGGSSPPDPGPATCGVDYTEDELDCAQMLECE